MTSKHFHYHPLNRICFTPKKDAYISEFYPTMNFGDRFYLFANQFQGCNDEYQSLIKFDLCQDDCRQIPPNSFIEKACLRLWIYRNEVPSNTTTDLCAYPVVQKWTELGVTWDTRPNFDSSWPFCTCISPGFINDWVEIDLTNLVKAWYKGYVVNDGILLKCDEPFDSLLGFYSREFEDSTYWPRLCVTYGVKCCVEQHRPHHNNSECAEP